MPTKNTLYIHVTRIFATALRLIRKAFESLLPQFSVDEQYSWRLSKQKFYHHLLKNLTIGIVIAVILHSYDFLLIRQAEDAAFDWVMAMRLGAEPVGITPNRPPQKFAFLDIDEATYRNWKEPFQIPRDKLLDIIQFAVSKKPALIVVDVDLSKPGIDPEQDQALADYLSQYQSKCNPPIILPQVFREPIEGESRRTVREPFFNKAKDKVKPGKTRVFLASPLFELDENDLRLRRWRLWEFTSDQTIVPSVELTAVSLLYKSNCDPVAAIDDVKLKLGKLTEIGATSESQIEIPGLGGINTDPEDIGQRIIYSIPGTLRNGETYPDNFGRSSVLQITKSPSPTKDQNPADICLTSGKVADTDHPDSSWLKDRVVVIGASFGDSRDIYATPIGQMPGAMVIVNAINSLYEHGQIKKPGKFWIFFIEIVLIILMSIAFAWFDDSFIGMSVSSTMIIVIMLPLSFYLFNYGVWLDFAIPLFAVQFHQIYSSFGRIQGSRPGKS